MRQRAIERHSRAVRRKEFLPPLALAFPSRVTTHIIPQIHSYLASYSDPLFHFLFVFAVVFKDHVETSRWSEKEIEIALQGEVVFLRHL